MFVQFRTCAIDTNSLYVLTLLKTLESTECLQNLSYFNQLRRSAWQSVLLLLP